MAESDHLDEFIRHAGPGSREELRRKFSRQKRDKGQYIFFEGDPADSIFLIESGVVEANVVHGEGKVYIYHFMFPGDIFGEGILFDEYDFPFSTVARGEVVYWKIPKDELLKIVNKDRNLERHLLSIVGHKLESAYMKERCIAGERVEKRVACTLLNTIEGEGTNPPCGQKYDSPLTNRDISGLIGSTEETVSRVMSRLKKEGVVGIKDKHLVVLDRDALMGFLDAA